MEVTCDYVLTDTPLPEGFDPGAHAWSVTLEFDGRSLTVPFFTGSLAGEPDATSVVDCLVSDALAGEESFENFCADFGYDEDSRRAYATWEQCKEQGVKVRELLGEHFDVLGEKARDGRPLVVDVEDAA